MMKLENILHILFLSLALDKTKQVNIYKINLHIQLNKDITIQYYIQPTHIFFEKNKENVQLFLINATQNKFYKNNF